MSFLFASTTLVYFILDMLIVVSMVAAILINEPYIFLVFLIIVIVAIFGMIIAGKMATKKYNKSLSKLDYDVHGFLNEQYRFLNKIFINKNVHNLIEMNIACGFINNEQYDKALEILSKFEMTGYQGLMPAMRFIAFANQAYCHIELGNLERAKPYIQSSEMILRTARLNNNSRYEFSLVFDNLVALFNYKMNPDIQNVQALIEKLYVRLNFAEQNNRYNRLILHYGLGVMYMRIGDTLRAESEFGYVLRAGSNLPCVDRIKAYNKTGDTSVLDI